MCSKKVEDEDGFVIPCRECNENGLMPWTQEDEDKYASMAAQEEDDDGSLSDFLS